MRHKKSQLPELRERIKKLAQSGFSYAEIAKIVKLKSAQLVCYHFRKIRPQAK